MIYAVTAFYNITDNEAYWEYGKEARDVVSLYGGRFLAASHNTFKLINVEGTKPDVLNIFIFPSKPRYMEFYNSPEYQKLVADRNKICQAQVFLLTRKEKPHDI
jgi:uncharacterized protein (DUF1330 family)